MRHVILDLQEIATKSFPHYPVQQFYSRKRQIGYLTPGFLAHREKKKKRGHEWNVFDYKSVNSD